MPSVVFGMNGGNTTQAGDARLGAWQSANHRATGQVVKAVTGVTVTLNQQQFNTFNNDANPMVRVRMANGSLEWYLWDTRFAQPSNTSEQGFTINLKRTVDPQGYTRDMGLIYRGHETWQGFGLRWFQDKNNNWFYVNSHGDLNKWDLAKWNKSTASGTARLKASSTFIGSMDPAAFKDPELLTGGPRGEIDSARALQQRLGLKSDGNFHETYGGLNVKWVQDRDNNWYFIKPNGRLWKWDKTPNRASGTFIGTLDASVYAHPNLLTTAQTLADPGTLMQQFGFHVASDGNLWQNNQGMNEKWFQDRTDTWYYITTGGEIYRRSQGTDTKIAVVDSQVWTDLWRLVAGLEKTGDWVKIPGPTKIV